MIQVQGLCKRFDDFAALQDLDLHVETGSIYGLIGVNGSGKTTLLKHIVGVLKADKGSIRIDGSEVYDSEKVKQRCACVPDELFFFGTYSLKQMAAFYKGIYKNWNGERFDEMVEDFKLDPARKLSKFSKGMQKQAAFILAMSTMPDYLILDEPIDGLDPIVRRQVWDYVVRDVAERSMTVLVSSHNLREMEGICDSIGILSDGKMRIERDLDELKSDIHKVQVAYPEGTDADDFAKGLKVLHKETRGSVHMYIIRGVREDVEAAFVKGGPSVFDILPLSLEEVFIYEMGGEHSDIKEILA